MRRIIELLTGASIVIFLVSIYNDQNGHHLLISLIIPYQPVRIIVFIALIFIAFRLIGGKPKDYSKYIYNILVKLFGDPYKTLNKK